MGGGGVKIQAGRVPDKEEIMPPPHLRARETS